MKYYIGIDNGVTGSIAILSEHKAVFLIMPTKTEQSYTKAKQNISRIDVPKLEDILDEHIKEGDSVIAMVERPMVNPGRFKATVSALRALEAVLVLLESKKIALEYIDSKEWQRILLPKGIEKEQLKKASLDIGKRLFPHCEKVIDKHKDADGLLIAEYCRRKFK